MFKKSRSALQTGREGGVAYVPASMADAYNDRLRDAMKVQEDRRKLWKAAVSRAQAAWDRHHAEQAKEWKKNPVLKFDRDVQAKVDALSRRLFRKYINFFQRHYLNNGAYTKVAVALQSAGKDRDFKDRHTFIPRTIGAPKKRGKKIDASGDPDV